jgi:hypothetical protein
MSNITVVAVADKNPCHDYLQMGWRAFIMSLHNFHYDHPLILGWGQEWRGLGSKPKLLKKAIEDGQITSEWIIFADAFDVAFVDSPDAIVAMSREWYPDARIVWNGERNLFPPTPAREEGHPKTAHPYRYFNSGLSVGRTQDYLTALSQMRVDEKPDDYRKPDGSWHHENDQEWWMEKFLWGQCSPGEPKMEIDVEAKLFQTMVGETMDNFTLLKSGLVKNKTTKQRPKAFHWNGPSKTAGTMEPILKQLGLL